jgi:hypothetical protein
MGIIRTRWKSLLIKEADGYALAVTHSIPLYFDHKSRVSLPKTSWILKIWLQNADELRPGYMPPETIKQRKWFPRGAINGLGVNSRISARKFSKSIGLGYIIYHGLYHGFSPLVITNTLITQHQILKSRASGG